jgi:hypothetical protein
MIDPHCFECQQVTGGCWRHAGGCFVAGQPVLAETDAAAERRRIVAYLRRDVGLHLERYYERRRVAEEIERGEHLK